ncbi:hypothetical protein JTE90_013923, partial [Oedothorax gibbosus]
LGALVNIEDFERCAPTLLETTARQYVMGAAGNGKTFRENKEAYKRIWIRGKRLRGFPEFSLETSVFGRTIPVPIGISPTAGHEIYHPEGGIGTARGASEAGAVVVHDQFSLTALEDVAAAVPNNTELWMQVFILPDRQVTLNMVHRAEAAGFKAIVVTVDEFYFTEIRCDARLNFFVKYDLSRSSPNLNTPNASLEGDYDPTVNFKDIAWLVKQTTLPIVVKGILTAEEAVGALKAGASAIFVSNQGGRELEDALPTIDALPAIAKAVRKQFPSAYVFVDGGIRNGHDVFKALARGAHMAFIGRPAIWGLTVGGSKGVEKVINILKDGFKNAMLHAGFARPSEITKSSVVSQWIYSDYY